MAVNLDLAAGAYLALYEELLEHPDIDLVDERAELLGTTIMELAALYRMYWNAHVSGTLPIEGSATPLGEHHGALASWLMAPMRAFAPTATFGVQVFVRSVALATDAGFDDLDPFKITVHGWVVGRVVGRVDRVGPVVPAPLPDDPHLRSAYEGLLEHVEQDWMLGRLYEVAGSAVVWRFGGLTEALSPQPDGSKDNIGASLSRLMKELGGELPGRIRDSLTADRQEGVVKCRNALTHVAERDNVGFAHAAEQSTDEAFVSPLIQAASYFVCAAIGRELQADEDFNRWTSSRERVGADLDWAADFINST